MYHFCNIYHKGKKKKKDKNGIMEFFWGSIGNLHSAEPQYDVERKGWTFFFWFVSSALGRASSAQEEEGNSLWQSAGRKGKALPAHMHKLWRGL